MRKVIITFISFFVGFCANQESSNFQIDKFNGVELETGKHIFFSKIKNSQNLVLNVYAPKCPPCLAEINTLEYLYEEIQKKKDIQLFMIVDPELTLNRVDITTENKTTEQILKEAAEVMRKEKEKYNISLPIILMHKPFKISTKGLVTGMPETLLFKTSPLILYYNFLGPIAIEKDLEKIKKEPKVLFLKRMLGMD